VGHSARPNGNNIARRNGRNSASTTGVRNQRKTAAPRVPSRAKLNLGRSAFKIGSNPARNPGRNRASHRAPNASRNARRKRSSKFKTQQNRPTLPNRPSRDAKPELARPQSGGGNFRAGPARPQIPSSHSRSKFGGRR